jgi:hypothetical protein
VFSLRHRELLLGAYSQRRAELCDAATKGSQSSPLHFTCTRLFPPKKQGTRELPREFLNYCLPLTVLTHTIYGHGVTAEDAVLGAAWVSE